MTNLSKELCEVCGIEPKLPCKRCGASKFALGQCAEVKCKAVYPDFENNTNNFVKLLEIINKKICIGALLICNLYYEYSFVKEFLRLLKRFLNGELEYGESAISEVKQAIRKEEWIYG